MHCANLLFLLSQFIQVYCSGLQFVYCFGLWFGWANVSVVLKCCSVSLVLLFRVEEGGVLKKNWVYFFVFGFLFGLLFHMNA